jgi:hypothetical protein
MDYELQYQPWAPKQCLSSDLDWSWVAVVEKGEQTSATNSGIE